MLLICSYCRKTLGEKPPLEDNRITHGMCTPCYEILIKQAEGISFSEYLNLFEKPVIIVDPTGRVQAANEAALKLINKPIEKVFGFLGGEALECQYARLEEGCGQTVHCSTCTVRILVESTYNDEQSRDCQPVSINTDNGVVYLMASTSYENGVVRLTLEKYN